MWFPDPTETPAWYGGLIWLIPVVIFGIPWLIEKIRDRKP